MKTGSQAHLAKKAMGKCDESKKQAAALGVKVERLQKQLAAAIDQDKQWQGKVAAAEVRAEELERALGAERVTMAERNAEAQRLLQQLADEQARRAAAMQERNELQTKAALGETRWRLLRPHTTISRWRAHASLPKEREGASRLTHINRSNPLRPIT